MSIRRRRLIALAYGTLCHGLFAAAVAAAIAGLWNGMLVGRGPFRGWTAAFADALLLLQFPLFHSLLLTRRGRRWLRLLAPRGLGDDLATTTFATLAAFQMFLVFALWSPSGRVWWRPEGAALAAMAALYAASWLFLVKALGDAGLAVQTGSLGWLAVLRGRRPQYGGFTPRGLFRSSRHPVYLGFALTLWTGPVWTPDRLVLAVLWTGYCLAGPLLKERRYEGWYGEAYRRYREAVPYMLPRPRRPRWPRAWRAVTPPSGGR